MKQYWRRLYVWPEGAILDGTGMVGLFGYMTCFDWREDGTATYHHLFGKFYYRQSRVK